MCLFALYHRPVMPTRALRRRDPDSAGIIHEIGRRAARVSHLRDRESRMFKGSSLRAPIFFAVGLLSACYTYPPPPEVRWVDTPVGKAVAVGGAVRSPQVIARVNPAATSSAGFVQARLVISEQGTVRNVEILAASDDAAVKSAREALAQWRFAPTIVNGAPVPVVHELKITFKQPG